MTRRDKLNQLAREAKPYAFISRPPFVPRFVLATLRKVEGDLF